MSLPRAHATHLVASLRAYTGSQTARPPTRAEHKELWLKTTIAMATLLIVPYTAFVLYKEVTHEHHEHGAHYPHMRIRRKVRSLCRACAAGRVCAARAQRARLASAQNVPGTLGRALEWSEHARPALALQPAPHFTPYSLQAFFWDESDCTIFDRKCIHEWRVAHAPGGKPALAAHH